MGSSKEQGVESPNAIRNTVCVCGTVVGSERLVMLDKKMGRGQILIVDCNAI